MSFGLFVFALLFASFANAQFMPAVDPEDLRNEPPLNLKDVEMFMAYMNGQYDYNKVQIHGTDEELDAAMEKMFDLMDSFGFTAERLVYAFQKIYNYCLVSFEGLSESEVPDIYKLNNDGKKFLDEHSSDLRKATEQLNTL
jgi:hypothetical protein